jgi:1-acyl-sn-glycerol-3-phosphate acyltransferase
MLIRQPFRPLGKIEIQKVPVFGIIYKVVVVVVDRSSSENRAKSMRDLKDVISKGISILIFPEGTFNETTNPSKTVMMVHSGWPLKLRHPSNTDFFRYLRPHAV